MASVKAVMDFKMRVDMCGFIGRTSVRYGENFSR